MPKKYERRWASPGRMNKAQAEWVRELLKLITVDQVAALIGISNRSAMDLKAGKTWKS